MAQIIHNRPAPAPRRRAFTMAELLVVIGIVVLLLAVLLPAVSKAWGSARRVECLSNVRQLAAAALAYAGDNRGYLPDAGSGNMPGYAPLSPRMFGKPPWTPLPNPKFPGVYVHPSVGGLLRQYLGEDAHAYWQCPSAPADNSVYAFQFTGDDPYNGTGVNDVFWPNYSYMAGKEWISQVNTPVAEPYRMHDWVSRNVSGLSIPRLSGSQPASNVVIFYERQSTYHSRKSRANIYFDKGDYYATFGYLDGRAEGKSYTDDQGYIDVLHRPIRQRWFGRDFATDMPKQYAETPPPPG